MKEYFYLENNEQKGPVTLEQLKALNLRRDNLIWADGMADWAPAYSVAELKEMFPPPAPVSHAASPTTTQRNAPVFEEINPFASSSGGEIHHSAPTVHATQIQSRFRLFMASYIVSFIIPLIAVIVGVVMDESGAREDEIAIMVGIASVFWLGAFLASLISNLSIVKAGWENIQDGYASTTPGNAVGLIFIPLFYYYWIFRAYKNLGDDINQYCQERQYSNENVVNENLVMAGVLTRAGVAVPYVGSLSLLANLVLWPIMINQLKEGVMFLVRAKAEAFAKQGF